MKCPMTFGNPAIGEFGPDACDCADDCAWLVENGSGTRCCAVAAMACTASEMDVWPTNMLESEEIGS